MVQISFKLRVRIWVDEELSAKAGWYTLCPINNDFHGYLNAQQLNNFIHHPQHSPMTHCQLFVQKFRRTLFILQIKCNDAILLDTAKKWQPFEGKPLFVQYLWLVVVFSFVQKLLRFFFKRQCEKQANCPSWHVYKSKEKLTWQKVQLDWAREKETINVYNR